jgi:branched-chain amino acid transport system ATP-binding protein
MLELQDVKAWYGRTQVLFGVDLQVAPGETLALVGTNGAGKTTTLRSALGTVKAEGRVVIDGHDVSTRPTHRRVRDCGLATVHEGRGLISSLTVLENLTIGASRKDRERVREIVDLFPALEGRLEQEVSLLSGGQQQMVALGRALLRQPRYLFLDEPGLGLAPALVQEIYGYVRDLRTGGMGVVLVEQSVARAASVADRLVLLRVGRVDRVVASNDQLGVQRLVADAFDLHDDGQENDAGQQGS